ncbi:2-hydroxyacid dehydrogenase [Rhodovibrionaceae bacterium A322]
MSVRPKILVSRHMPEAVAQRLAESYDATLFPEDHALSAEQIVTGAQGQAGLLISSTEKMTSEVINQLPDSVKIIATFSVGYEHIDLAAAKARGILVTNTPDVLTDATADITLLCLLGAARRAYEGQEMLRQGKWDGWSTTQLCGVQVTGKRLGIFGMGRIGQAVADRARGFNMTIHYHNRSRLPAELEKGAIYHESPEDLLPHSDFLSLNCPATPETTDFINRDTINLLPQGAVVVNTSRGPVVNDDALIEALNSGRLASAGLDVFTGEPQLDPRYRDIQNAFLLPHLGSATTETRNAMGFTCLDNLDAYFAGAQPPHALT